MVLTLILCSRNDRYMGDSLWRLETTLNEVADRVHECGRLDDVEVIVSDWGSEVPLREVISLTKPASTITSFLWIPPEMARPLQGDSSFPEVLALNAAARRARGTYIGRIDQDTLVGQAFFDWFFAAHERRRALETPLDQTLWYANRRDIPYRFAVQCPTRRQVGWFVRLFGQKLGVPRIPVWPFWTYWVGIWLAHRDCWSESGGYDERLLHYNWMEVDMIGRLRQNHALADLGAIVNYDFYHLEHVNPRIRGPRHHKKNPDIDWNVALGSISSRPEWGLPELSIACVPSGTPAARAGSRSVLWEIPSFVWAVARTAISMWADRVVIFIDRSREVWRGRTRRAWAAMRTQPVSRWPRVVLDLWRGRATRIAMAQPPR